MQYKSTDSNFSFRGSGSLIGVIGWAIGTLAVLPSISSGQVASHPDAKSPLPTNPYLKHSDPWRWDIRSQVILRGGVRHFPNDNNSTNTRDERFESVSWAMKDLEVVFPVAREGGFYWSPNVETTVSIRADDFTPNTKPERWFTNNTKAEYTLWRSDIEEYVYQIHVINTSHIVSADTVFDHKKAQHLTWPESWSPQATSYLSPIVDSMGEEVDPEAAETIKELLNFWVEDKDPKMLSELDLVKFLTGKVIEYTKVQTPAAEIATRTTRRYSGAVYLGGSAWSGFLVRPADVVARNPGGSKHDLASLLTAVLRSAGVPARTVLCINTEDEDILNQLVSMVEFAMYDPERDLTFWVPIDIDRLRLNGKRANQYKQWWNYFGTHDLLSDYVPLGHYFHPPASYRGNDLPALYGIRSSSPIPEYVFQSLIIDPMVSPVTAESMKPKPVQP